ACPFSVRGEERKKWHAGSVVGDSGANGVLVRRCYGGCYGGFRRREGEVEWLRRRRQSEAAR
ncbi:hypothetical protein HAX54_034489, partial [Datura stramonium]|nr:hypothetical protein [Datura stramonium]